MSVIVICSDTKKNKFVSAKTLLQMLLSFVMYIEINEGLTGYQKYFPHDFKKDFPQISKKHLCLSYQSRCCNNKTLVKQTFVLQTNEKIPIFLSTLKTNLTPVGAANFIKLVL